MQGDSGYENDRTNTNYNIMMRFPKFYYNRPSKWEFQVSSYPHEGFLPSPLHYRNGVMHDYAYIAKYYANSSFRSQTGQQPLISTSSSSKYLLASFREEFNNQGMCVWDFQLISSLQILCIIKYATLDVQSLIGYGFKPGTGLDPKTGCCDSVKGLDGVNNTNKNIVCLGIEDLYNHFWRFLDGIFVIPNGSNTPLPISVYINTDFENLKTGQTNPTNGTSGYQLSPENCIRSSGIITAITDISYNSTFPYAMYPITTTGVYTNWPSNYNNISTPIKDGVRVPVYSQRIGQVLFGGSYLAHAGCGLFCLYMVNNSNNTFNEYGESYHDISASSFFLS